MMNRFKELFSLWDNREDLEHQQAMLRMAVGLIVFGYLVYTIFLDKYLSSRDIYVLSIACVYFTSAFAIIIWLSLSPKISATRRVLGIVADTAAISGALYFHGALGAPLFIIYLWISFGNGFRYGQKYLFLSAILSIIGFTLVTQLSPYYEMDKYITFGLFVGLIILPLYVASLLTQLNKSLDVAKKANEAKSTFLATMSHEIRTPLNGMVGITEILGRTELSSQQHHYVNLISRSSEWLMRVITDGLDFSKIEAGEFILSKETFDLSASLIHFCSLYQDLQKNQDVRFVSSVDNNLPDLVVGDQLRLNQVLSNLVSNSLKFTSRGEVTFSAKVILKKREGMRIQFTVTDTGPGIAFDKQAVIFEPFRQEDGGITKRFGGTGLGLAIASKIVLLMGGKLVLKSTPGEGAVLSFNLYFPEPSKEEVKAVEEDNKKTSDSHGWKRKPQLLVVEDNEINREVILNQLENMDCEAVLVVNGREAVEYLNNNQVDLVLMDCQMPLMDGYTATRMIREKEERKGDGVRLPIVALTAHVTVDDKRKCLESGMDDYLGKPFTSELLRKKLYRWLQPLLSAQIKRATFVTSSSFEKNRTDSLPVEDAGQSENEKLLHDLKNMHLAIYGSAELALMDTRNSDGQRKHMERIYSATQEANRIVESLATNCTEKR